MTCLEQQIHEEEFESARAREKGDKTKQLKGKILNVRFLLTLSGLADIYEQFGIIVNISQMIHLLPHERLEKCMDAFAVFQKMKECFNDHSMCKSLLPDGYKKKCLWPLNHKDKQTLKEKSEIRGIPVISENTIRAAGLQTETRSMRVKEQPSGQSTSNKQILSWLNEIYYEE